MINGSDIREYRQIKAPAELRSKVLKEASAAKRRKYFPDIKAMSAIAACLMMLVVGSALLNMMGAPVTVSVEDHTPAAVSARLQSSVTLVLKSKGKLTVEAESEGFYYRKDGELIPLDVIKNVNNELEVIWQVSDTPAELKVNGEVYEVSYLEDNAKVSVNKIEK